jgi:hypothetical protein
MAEQKSDVKINQNQKIPGSLPSPGNFIFGDFHQFSEK